MKTAYLRVPVLLIAIIFVLSLSLAGCSSVTTTSSPTTVPTADITVSPTASPTPAPITTTKADALGIHIALATDATLSKYSSFNEYLETRNSEGERVIIWTDKMLKNFNFIAIDFNTENNNYSQTSVLYSLSELSPEKPFVVRVFFRDSWAREGISFTDEKNAKEYFYISESGMDSSLSLIEFENKKSTPAPTGTPAILEKTKFALTLDGIPFGITSSKLLETLKQKKIDLAQPDPSHYSSMEEQGIKKPVKDGRWYNSSDFTYYYQTKNGMQFWYNNDNGTLFLFSTDSFATVEGLKIGDSIDKMKSVYGTNYVKDVEDSPCYQYYNGKQYLTIFYKDNKVTAWWISTWAGILMD